MKTLTVFITLIFSYVNLVSADEWGVAPIAEAYREKQKKVERPISIDIAKLRSDKTYEKNFNGVWVYGRIIDNDRK